MKVGYISSTSPPGSGRELLTSAAFFRGIEFFLFDLKDVDIETKTIRGWFWDSSECRFICRSTSYPDIVDGRYNRKKAAGPIIKELRKYCLMTMVRLNDKKKINAILDTHFPQYTISTQPYTFSRVKKLIQQPIIIKPKYLNKGRGIYKVSRTDENILVHHKHTITTLNTIDEFKQNYDHMFSKGHIIQPFMDFTTKSHCPYDIRVNVCRGKDGKWVHTGTFPRIGNSGGVISNIAAGGYIIWSGYKYFLESEYGKRMRNKILDEITFISTTVPEIIQSKYKNTLMRLGFDLGIDRASGAIKIIEINGNPNARPAHSAAATKVEYYKYLYSNFDKLLAVQNSEGSLWL